MAGRIPEHVIDEIRRRANIVDVIGRHVALKKRGRRYVALCPFHDDHNPSMNVNPEMGLYKCFSCGAGGNVITFLMEYNRMTFVEAVEELGRQTGVDVPRVDDDGPSRSRRDEMNDVNEFAAGFFRAQRQRLGADSGPVRYLTDKRKLTDETIQRFDLGFAPDDWQAFVDALRSAGKPLDVAFEVGLLGQSEDSGRYYDKFRNRVMCPIRDAMGRVVAFSGRTLGDDRAKYMNSTDSPVFNKSRQFYGLDLARDAIRKSRTVLVVEGNFDVIRMHQEGFGHTVAALGTAVTADHVRVLARLAETIVLVFDGDAAGRQAAFRSMETFLDADVEPRVVILADGEDPDSFLNDRGAEALATKLKAARPILESFLDSQIAQADGSVDATTRAVRNVSRVLAKIDNGVRRSLYAQQLAERTGLHVDEINQAVGHARSESSGQAPGTPWERSKPTTFSRVERTLAQLAFQHPDRVLPQLPADVVETITDERLEAILGQCVSRWERDQTLDPAGIGSAFDDAGIHALISDLSMSDPIADAEIVDEVVTDCIEKIRRDASTRMRKKILSELERAEKEGDSETASRLHKELQGYRPAPRVRSLSTDR